MSFFRNKSFAIDLGNSNTLVADQERILLSQPSYIVFDSNTNKVRAVGDRAYDMFEKNHQDLKSVKPLKWGVIADYQSAWTMMREMVTRTFAGKMRFSGYDQIISGVPYAATEVERRALRDALDQFNPKKRYLIFEPLAAALGMGLNIHEPDGHMVIDIGGGLTEVVIISLSGIAVLESAKVAGDTFTADIQDYLRRQYNLQVGWKTAEQIKVRVGAVLVDIPDEPEPMFVKGKDVLTGLPVIRSIGHAEISRALEKSVQTIEEHIVHALEACPPELSADIYRNGVHLTGGGSLLRGLAERLSNTIQLPVLLDKDPMLSVGRGMAMALANTRKYKSILFE